jgi:hypothetical protein
MNARSYVKVVLVSVALFALISSLCFYVSSRPLLGSPSFVRQGLGVWTSNTPGASRTEFRMFKNENDDLNFGFTPIKQLRQVSFSVSIGLPMQWLSITRKDILDTDRLFVSDAEWKVNWLVLFINIAICIAATMATRYLIQRQTHQYRRRRALCISCSYQLTPSSRLCPECGTSQRDQEVTQ